MGADHYRFVCYGISRHFFDKKSRLSICFRYTPVLRLHTLLVVLSLHCNILRLQKQLGQKPLK